MSQRLSKEIRHILNWSGGRRREGLDMRSHTCNHAHQLGQASKLRRANRVRCMHWQAYNGSATAFQRHSNGSSTVFQRTFNVTLTDIQRNSAWQALSKLGTSGAETLTTIQRHSNVIPTAFQRHYNGHATDLQRTCNGITTKTQRNYIQRKIVGGLQTPLFASTCFPWISLSTLQTPVCVLACICKLFAACKHLTWAVVY